MGLTRVIARLVTNERHTNRQDLLSLLITIKRTPLQSRGCDIATWASDKRESVLQGWGRPTLESTIAYVHSMSDLSL